MANHIILGDLNTNWRLDPTVNVDRISAQLRDAASVGAIVPVAVTTPDSLASHTIWVNPSQLGWWTIMNFRDADA